VSSTGRSQENLQDNSRIRESSDNDTKRISQGKLLTVFNIFIAFWLQYEWFIFPKKFLHSCLGDNSKLITINAMNII
jgi:hypothetical protein